MSSVSSLSIPATRSSCSGKSVCEVRVQQRAPEEAAATKALGVKIYGLLQFSESASHDQVTRKTARPPTHEKDRTPTNPAKHRFRDAMQARALDEQAEALPIVVPKGCTQKQCTPAAHETWETVVVRNYNHILWCDSQRG